MSIEKAATAGAVPGTEVPPVDFTPPKITRLTDPLLTTSEVARVLHIHVNTVRAWSDLGILKSFRLGPRQDRRFKLKDVEEFIMNYPITDTPES